MGTYAAEFHLRGRLDNGLRRTRYERRDALAVSSAKLLTDYGEAAV